MQRFVLDTSVIVAARRSPSGASACLIALLRQRRFVALATIPLFFEYEAVLKRPEHMRDLELEAAKVDAVLDALAALVDPVTVHYLWRPQLRDPADELVLEAAVNGRADAIITFNTRDFAEAVGGFGLDLLLPAEALGRIG